MDWPAVWLTFRLATTATLVLCAAGMPLAWWLATTRWRGRFAVEALVALPLVLPPVVLGYYLLVAFSPASRLGSLVAWATGGGTLAFSFWGLVFASVLFSLPFAVRPMIEGFATVDRRLLESSWCLGVSPAATFFRIVVPLSWAHILTGMILSFAHTVGEFGVVLMVGGNIPGRTRTMSIVIYDHVQALDYAAAGRTAFVLLAFSFAVLSLVFGLNRRVRAA